MKLKLELNISIIVAKNWILYVIILHLHLNGIKLFIKL